MRIVPASETRHARAMLALFNHEMAHSTALYEHEPRTLATMAEWFAQKTAGGWPTIVAEDDEDGRLLGFASYGSFRAYPAFSQTVEHSVYVAVDARRRGVARALMQAMIGLARDEAVHVMIGAIDRENTASIALHEALGFEAVGHLKQTGRKFGRWLDLLLYQRIVGER